MYLYSTVPVVVALIPGATLHDFKTTLHEKSHISTLLVDKCELKNT